ncbi:ATP-binding protein [Desulfohalobium retbaense]|uniref:PP-loop domain protein n=1 Tax=Desulfohalobium retbaense (strain ATCC 49708 / DSM 5692 / JCM 16813 / HR100) TaxID=485915 RepID=C8X2K4_DESRD|nr:ATP-binding protein [Desulfohalobium retbaense]ACV68651.1 PP-loop domain protein [Desulfohalobium retbaense DSM 5692]
MKCKRCKEPAVVALPSHHTGFCEPCFLQFFQRQVKRAIKEERLFTPEDRILVAVSGGKDSLALLWQLRDLGYNVHGLHVDLGIPDSSDRAKTAIAAFCDQQAIPLHIVSTEEAGVAIPDLAERIDQPVCSFCGKIKRHFFNTYAVEHGFNVLATGHNLDDEVSRLFANTLGWKTDYLATQGPLLPADNGFARKVKPLYRHSEFETAAFCFLKGIEHVKAPCPYSQGASFTLYKKLLNDLETEQPGRKLFFYQEFLRRAKNSFQDHAPKHPPIAPCIRCGAPTSAEICSVCRLRNKLATT